MCNVRKMCAMHEKDVCQKGVAMHDKDGLSRTVQIRRIQIGESVPIFPSGKVGYSVPNFGKFL